jgi:hypothetical protein
MAVFPDKAHFLAYAGRAMRSIIIECGGVEHRVASAIAKS